jgi:hypothetical protein
VKYNNDKSRDYTNPNLPTGDAPLDFPSGATSTALATTAAFANAGKYCSPEEPQGSDTLARFRVHNIYLSPEAAYRWLQFLKLFVHCTVQTVLLVTISREPIFGAFLSILRVLFQL